MADELQAREKNVKSMKRKCLEVAKKERKFKRLITLHCVPALHRPIFTSTWRKEERLLIQLFLCSWKKPFERIGAQQEEVIIRINWCVNSWKCNTTMGMFEEVFKVEIWWFTVGKFFKWPQQIGKVYQFVDGQTPLWLEVSSNPWFVRETL